MFVALDRELARTYFEAMLELKKELGAAGEIGIETILRAPGVLRAPGEQLDPEDEWPHVEAALKAALRDLVQMREREGKHLAKDLIHRLKTVRTAVRAIRALQPGVVTTLNEIQWTPATTPDPSRPYRRSPANSRLIWGRNAQISFVRMDPGSEFPRHVHPEDQLTHTVRGTADQGVMDATYPVSGTAANMLLLPGGMVHSAKLGDTGADQLDVFWPVTDRSPTSGGSPC